MPRRDADGGEAEKEPLGLVVVCCTLAIKGCDMETGALVPAGVENRGRLELTFCETDNIGPLN